jgi:hypothetical protein
VGTQLAVAGLIQDIAKGELILPEFQRGYVWTRTQVREYLASLYRGYPTGSFLIWKTPNPGLIRGESGNDGAGAFQLILDGQQRLTSVYSLVTGQPPPFYEGEELHFDIYFNVKTEEFSYFKPIAMKGSPEWLPVTRFLQYGLGEYLKAGGPISSDERDFLMNFFDKLVQLDAIKSYTYYLDILSQRDMEEVVRIFNLVNSQGTRLSKSDLALSHICALWPEARQEMRDAQREFSEAGFHFDLAFYVRCTSSVATGSGRYEPLYGTSVEDIKSAWGRTKKVVEYLINVLRFDAFIDSGANLATDMVLVPLVVYLANGNGSFQNDREKRSFLHWMYAALMWARYSGSTETKLQEDLEGLRSDDPPARLRDNLVADRGRIRVEGSDLEGRTSQSPFFTLCYVVARAAGAVDWFNGLPLYSKLVGKSNGLEHHHIFPQKLLYEKGGYNSGVRHDVNRVNEIANIAFLTKQANLRIGEAEPAKYFPRVMETYPKALAQQEIPVNTAVWALDRYEDFLAERRQRLAGAINGFMDDLLAEEEKPRFTIADYIGAGEGETVEFKASLRWDHREKQVNRALEKAVARTVAGFMNLKGGTLVIGVSDEGEIWGLEADFATLTFRKDRDGWEQALRNVLNAYLSKEVAVLIGVTFAGADGKTVAVVRADPALKPIYLMDHSVAEFYVRSGNTTQQLDVKQANDYIRQRFPAVG